MSHIYDNIDTYSCSVAICSVTICVDTAESRVDNIDT